MARANKTFIVQASLKIVTYNCQNIFIIQATGKTLIVGGVGLGGAYQTIGALV
jgi:hypothetical protein